MAAKSDGAAACVAELERERERESREDVGNRGSARAGRSPLLDCCWVVCALLVFFSDAATDLWLAADYYARRDYWWFALTLVFVAVPSAVVQVLSFRWFVYDYTEMEETEDRREEQEATDEGGDCHLGSGGGGSKGGGGGGGGGGGSAARSTSRTLRCCRACMWLFQSVVHILQLGQAPTECHSLVLKRIRLAKAAALCTGVGFLTKAKPVRETELPPLKTCTYLIQVCGEQQLHTSSIS
ncbi:hypothetical protein AOLI_G00160760 [Acnodon oligacanthus]